MISGPVSYIPDTNEELYSKQLSTEEYNALELPENPSYKAITVQVQKNEVICVLDHAKNTEKYIFGPISYILKENEVFFSKFSSIFDQFSTVFQKK